MMNISKQYIRIKQGLSRRLRVVACRTRAYKYKFYGINMGDRCLFGKGIDFLNGCNTSFGNECIIDSYAQFKCPTSANQNSQYNIRISDNVFIGRGTVIDSNLSIGIGKNTFVAPFCFITDTNHSFTEHDTPVRLQGCRYEPVLIGEDVWIGAHVVIVAGVIVGDSSVIAANSTVTRNVPPGAIVGGSPARLIKFRPGFQ